MTTTARGVLRNTLAVTASHGLGHGLRLVSTLLLLAALPRREFGVLAFAVALVDPVRALAALGLDTAALRRAGREPERLPELLGTLLSLRVRLAGVAFLACLPLGLFRTNAPGGIVVVVAAGLAVLPAGVTGPITVAFQARHRMHRIVLLPALASGVHIAVVLLLWAAGAPLAAFVAAAAAGEAAAASALARAVKKEVGEPLSRDPDLARELVREGLPLAAVNLAVVVYGRLGIWLLDHWDGPGAVADYGAARRLVEPIVTVGAALAVSANPHLSRLAKEGRTREAGAFLLRALLVSLALLAPAAVVVAHYAEPLVLALKPEYLGAVPAFRWLVAGAVAMFVCQVLSAGLVAVGRFRTLALLAFVNLAVFAALAFPLVPRLGATGAAIATAAMEGLNLVLQGTLVAVFLGRRGRPGPRPLE